MMRKRFLSLTCALVLCLSLLPVTALAAAPNGQVIYVGNENVTNGGYWTTDSAGTVTAFTGEGTPADNFIYYDASRNTLTLHNATIRMSVSIDTNTLLAGAAIGVLMTEIQHELIMPNKDLPFKMFLFEGRDGNYIREKHWHRSIEIFAVFQGTLEFYLNDQEYLLECGDFIIVNSNEVHSIHAPKENMTVVLQMPLNMFEKYYTGDQFICFAHAPQAQDEQLMEMICEMYMAYSDKHCGYDLKIQSLFYDMLYLMVTRYREINVHPDILHQHKQLTKLSVITDYMKEHYKEELSLSKLAEIFGYSPSYLSRMFQKYAGINYKDYMQAIRTEHGYRQLVETDMTISDISMENGFPNNKAFSKAFYKKYGIMPAEFRKRQKSAINKISN